MKPAQIGLIGLGVMGQNFARNIAGKNIPVVVYNRTTEKTTKFIKKYGNENLFGESEIKNFIERIETPRKIIIMVQAGPAVDMVIEEILKYSAPEDIIIDCGNSNFRDTQRRFFELKSRDFCFMGCGVSGGEEGALKGPSLMPGGDKKTWKILSPIFSKIAAKDFSFNPCVTYIGDNGAGHYVKMVHNGIEYAVMELMAEAYDILRKIYKLSSPKIAEIFENYNKGKLSSYLFEISVSVLNRKDTFKKGFLIDYILDEAGQKGTGSWTAVDSLERAISLSIATEAVYARIISGEKKSRKNLSKIYKENIKSEKIPLEKFIKFLENAIYAGMLLSYAQGYELIKKAAKEEKWEIDLSEISRIWEGGCIIRAKILNFLHKAYKKSKIKSPHLLEIPEIAKEIKTAIPDLKKIVSFGAQNTVPIPALKSALSYFDAITSENLPANFIQGLRDYFGAHTYERTDKKGNFHTNWVN